MLDAPFQGRYLKDVLGSGRTEKPIYKSVKRSVNGSASRRRLKLSPTEYAPRGWTNWRKTWIISIRLTKVGLARNSAQKIVSIPSNKTSDFELGSILDLDKPSEEKMRTASADLIRLLAAPVTKDDLERS